MVKITHICKNGIHNKLLRYNYKEKNRFTTETNGCTLYKNRKQNKRYKEKGIAYEGTKKSGMSRTAGNV